MSKTGKGISILEHLSAENSGEASYELARLYQNGVYFNKDLASAERLYLKSYRQKYKPALKALGVVCFDEQKYDDSYNYFERSLNYTGGPEALFYLGLMEVYGISGESERVLAGGYLKIKAACNAKYKSACDFIEKNDDQYNKALEVLGLDNPFNDE